VGPDLDYGDCGMDDEHLQKACEEYYNSDIKVTKEEARKIEEESREQAKCVRWRKERRKRVTASFVKITASRKETTLSAPLVKAVVYPAELKTPATNWGNDQEDTVRKKYEEEFDVKIQCCALFIDTDHPFLAGSPDGIVQNEENSDRYIIEIKCPYSARNCDSISQACDIARNFPLCKKIDEKTQKEEITLSKNTRITTKYRHSYIAYKWNCVT